MYKKITTIEEYSEAPQAQFSTRENSKKKYAPCVRVDIPLLIRLLEFAREEASNDVDLHVLASEMIAMSEEGRVLTIDDYDEILEGVEKTITVKS